MISEILFIVKSSFYNRRNDQNYNEMITDENCKCKRLLFRESNYQQISYKGSKIIIANVTVRYSG